METHVCDLNLSHTLVTKKLLHLHSWTIDSRLEVDLKTESFWNGIADYVLSSTASNTIFFLLIPYLFIPYQYMLQQQISQLISKHTRHALWYTTLDTSEETRIHHLLEKSGYINEQQTITI